MKIIKNKIRKIYKYIIFYIIKIFKIKNKFYKLHKEFLKNKSFNLTDLDKKIGKYTEIFYKNNIEYFHNYNYNVKTEKNKICFLATILYDNGGHTEILKNLIISLKDLYKIKLVLSDNEKSKEYCSRKLDIISQHTTIKGVYKDKDYNTKNIIDIYNEIIDFNPKVLFCFMHPDDLLSDAVLSLIKINTNIKIFYFNHASHFPALGFSFSDLILECIPSTQYVTEHFRNVHKCYKVGLISCEKEYTKYFTKEELKELKKSLNIDDDNYFTLSGATSYKFFDNENTSKYFEMIRDLLHKEKKLKHLIITELNEKEKKIMENVFINHLEERKRLLFHDFVTNFDIYFQACDLFIDSFPVSSALTQIDLMRNKKTTIVKINKENSLFSFHEYMSKDYPYMFEDIDDMKNCILKLLYDENKRNKISNILYDFYLNNYEQNIVKSKYINLIENSDNIENYYQTLDSNLNYNFINIK